MTTTIGTQFPNPWDERRDYGRISQTYREEQEKNGDDEKCNFLRCENPSTHLAYCAPAGNGCGLHAPWCIDHVLDTVSKSRDNPLHTVIHGKHEVLGRHVTYTPKR